MTKYKKLLLILSIVLIVFFTLIVRETMEVRHSGNRGISLVPFRGFAAMFKEDDRSHYFWQIFLNILLFVPFGYALTSVLNKNCTDHKKHCKLNAWLFILAAGFALSLLIEIFQYVTSRGYSEVDDVINNTIGTAIGYLVYKQFMRFCKNRKKKLL